MGVKFTGRVNAYVSDGTRETIESIVRLPAARERGLGFSDVIRQALDVGLPVVAQALAGTGAQRARKRARVRG